MLGMDINIQISPIAIVDDFDYYRRQYKLDSITESGANIIEIENYLGQRIVLKPKNSQDDLSLVLNNDSVYTSMSIIYEAIRISYKSRAVRANEIPSILMEEKECAVYYANKQKFKSLISNNLLTYTEKLKAMNSLEALARPQCSFNTGLNLSGYNFIYAEQNAVTLLPWINGDYFDIELNIVAYKEHN